MKSAPFFLVFAVLLATAPSVHAAKSFVSETRGGKTVNVVKVVLDGTTRIVTPYAGDGGATFDELLKKAGSDTGINGAYFCPADYSWCGKTYTNADRAYEGKQDFKFGGDFGAKGFFWFDSSGTPLFVLDNVWYGKGISRSHNADRKGELANGISNIPVLLLEGADVLSESESELDSKMRTSSTKSFICSDATRDTVYFGTVSNVTAYELPPFLKAHFGCHDAIGLDNGGSMGLKYAGKSIRTPGRKIMDAFAVVETSVAPSRTDKNADAIVAAVARKKRAMRSLGKTDAEIAAWVASIRSKFVRISELQPGSPISATLNKALRSPVFK